MMDVMQQQCHLTATGDYTLRRKDGSPAIDGIPGPATKAAIQRFQEKHKQRPDGTTLVVDGVWGPATEKALREVIGTDEPAQDAPDPVAPDQPDLPAGEYPWLEDIGQIRCQCNGQFCKGLPVDRKFSPITLGWANEIGRQLGVKIKCTSGYRCPQHNARIPGASPNSKHKLAIAMDIQAADHSVSAKRLYDVADKLIGDQGGVGIYSWGIHIDSRGYGSRWDYR